MTSYCVELDQASELGPTDVGQKAFNLAQMATLGIPVPPGLVVTRHAFDASGGG